MKAGLNFQPSKQLESRRCLDDQDSAHVHKNVKSGTMRYMKGLYALVAIFLVGCSSSNEPEPITQEEVSHKVPSVPAEENTDDGAKKTKQGPCGTGYEQQTFVIDGGTWTVIVPSLCDPLYHYIGDPQPKN